METLYDHPVELPLDWGQPDLSYYDTPTETSSINEDVPVSYETEFVPLHQNEYSREVLYSIDVTKYFVMTMNRAAQLLGINKSTFFRRWSVSTGGKRKWPYRKLKELDGKIAHMVAQTKQPNVDLADFDQNFTRTLEALLEQRKKLLVPTKVTFVQRLTV